MSLNSFHQSFYQTYYEGIAELQTRGHRGDGVRIGHLDTGVDATHPALAGRVASFRRFGYRGITEEPAPIHDSGWHGTHTAGLLVGQSIDGHCIGIAPDAQLCSGMVLEEGNLIARILSGLDWLLGQNVHVVNLSLGISTETPIFQPLVQEMIRRDIVVVAPIGNSGAGKASAPGYYPEVLSVGAVDATGRVPRFSGSYHRDGDEACHKPDVTAPGVDIRSTAPNNGLTGRSGTSMASVQVAGVVALLRAAFPQLPGATIQAALSHACRPRWQEQRHRSAAGCIDPIAAFAALAHHGEDIDLPTTVPPLERGPRESVHYIDPRLQMQLALAGDAGLCEAVFLFDSPTEAKRCGQLLTTTDNPLDDVHKRSGNRMKYLHHIPMLICQTSPTVIRQVLQWPSLSMASACDTNRLVW